MAKNTLTEIFKSPLRSLYRLFHEIKFIDDLRLRT